MRGDHSALLYVVCFISVASDDGHSSTRNMLSL